jgi:hypothetical protein
LDAGFDAGAPGVDDASDFDGGFGAISTAVLMLVLTVSMTLVALLAILTLALGVSTPGSEDLMQQLPTWEDFQGSRA